MKHTPHLIIGGLVALIARAWKARPRIVPNKLGLSFSGFWRDEAIKHKLNEN